MKFSQIIPLPESVSRKLRNLRNRYYAGAGISSLGTIVSAGALTFTGSGFGGVFPAVLTGIVLSNVFFLYQAKKINNDIKKGQLQILRGQVKKKYRKKVTHRGSRGNIYQVFSHLMHIEHHELAVPEQIYKQFEVQQYVEAHLRLPSYELISITQLPQEVAAALQDEPENPGIAMSKPAIPVNALVKPDTQTAAPLTPTEIGLLRSSGNLSTALTSLLTLPAGGLGYWIAHTLLEAGTAPYKLWSAAGLAMLAVVPAVTEVFRRSREEIGQQQKHILTTSATEKFYDGKKYYLKIAGQDFPVSLQHYEQFTPGDQVRLHRSLKGNFVFKVETAARKVLFEATGWKAFFTKILN